MLTVQEICNNMVGVFNQEHNGKYFITTLEKFEKSEKYGYLTGSKRCVGYLSSKEEVFEAVKNNSCDSFETCYLYCIIEYIKEGFYQYAWEDNERWLFKFNLKTKKYEQIPFPKDCKIVGFGIGQ